MRLVNEALGANNRWPIGHGLQHSLIVTMLAVTFLGSFKLQITFKFSHIRESLFENNNKVGNIHYHIHQYAKANGYQSREKTECSKTYHIW